MVLISISLMISDVEHLFMYLRTICMSCLEKFVFRSFALLKIRILLLLSCVNFLYILNINPYLICGLQIFSAIP